MGYRDLLKEATQLKKQKRYNEASQMLKDAYQEAREDEYVDIHERLRLPTYLCFADKDEEAWTELERLAGKYTDPISQIAIRSKMQKFLEDDDRLNDSLVYLAWVYVLDLKYRIDQIIEMHQAADHSALEEPLKVEMDDGKIVTLDFNKMNQNQQPLAFTELGNPIYDVAHNHLLKSLNDRLNPERIEYGFEELCIKLNRQDLPPIITDKILEILGGQDDIGAWVDDLYDFLKTN
ncbi:hypothetical protein DYG63_20275 [Yersinia enterocolitica]|nr:hypothetical protein [Yersinia enterocolitica]